MLDIVDDMLDDSDISTAMETYNISITMATVVFRYFFVTMAHGFHYAVVKEGLTAYCNATKVSNPPECEDVEIDDGTYSGSEVTVSEDYPSSNSIIATCELWKFPDGNGSYYYMFLNCQYSLKP